MIENDTLAPPRITQTMIVPGSIKPRHIESGSALVKFGVAADRPTEGTLYPFYVAYDTNVVSIWNGTAWKSSTFS